MAVGSVTNGIATAGIMGAGLSVLQRAARAALHGPRHLGGLSLDAFRESDIVSHEGYLYVLSTENAAGGAPGTIWAIQSTAPGNPTLVTLTTPHGLRVGTRQYVFNFKDTLVPGLSGAKFCTAPSANTLSVLQNTLVAGSAGSVEYSLSAVPFVGLRRAPTPEAITAAASPDYVSRVSGSIYYPSLVVEGSGASAVWHLFGYNAGGTATAHRTYTGLFPPSLNAFTSTGSDLNVLLGDVCVRKHSTSNYYAIGNTDLDGFITALYWNDNINDNAGWEQVAANIWAGGVPAWADGYHPDPSIAFLDGACYLTFTAGLVSGQWTTAITTLDAATGVASVGNVVILQEYGAYKPWQRGQVLSDLTLVRDGAGRDRIYGFTNSGTFLPTGEWGWGCWDLSPSGGGAGTGLSGRGTVTAAIT